MLPQVSPAFRFSKEMKPQRGSNGDRPGGAQDAAVNMQSHDDVQMHIERSVFVDGALGSVESFERGIYGTPRYTWNQGYAK